MNDQIKDLFDGYMRVTGNFAEAAATLVLAHVLTGFEVQIDDAVVKDLPAPDKAVNVTVLVNGEEVTPRIESQSARAEKLCQCPQCNAFFGTPSK